MPREDELLDEEQEFLQEVVERVADHLEYVKLEIFRRLEVFVTDKEQQWLKRFCKKNMIWFEPKDGEQPLDLSNPDSDEEEDLAKGKQYFDEELSCLLKYWKEEFLLRFKSHQQLEQEKSTKSQFTSDQIRQILNGTDNALRYASNMKQSIMEKEHTVEQQGKELQILNGIIDRREELLDVQRKEHYRELFFLKEQIAQFDFMQKNSKQLFATGKKRKNEGPLGQVQDDLIKVKEELAGKHDDIQSMLMKLTGVQLKIHEQATQKKLDKTQVLLLQSEAQEVKDMVDLMLSADGWNKSGVSVQKLQEENAALRLKVEELDKDVFSLRNLIVVGKIASADDEAEANQVVKPLPSAETVIEELKQQPVPERKKRATKESKETQQKFATLIQKIESMRLQLTVKDGEIRQMKNETTSLYAKINSLKGKLNDTIEERHHTKLNEEKEKMEAMEVLAKQQRIQMINEDLRMRLFDYVEKLKASSNTMLKLNALKNTYRNEAISAERDVRAFQRDMSEMQIKCNTYVETVSELTDKIKILQEQVGTLEEANKQLLKRRPKSSKSPKQEPEPAIVVEEKEEPESPSTASSYSESSGASSDTEPDDISSVKSQSDMGKSTDQPASQKTSARSSIVEDSDFKSHLELMDTDFEQELGAALKFTEENLFVVPNIEQFKTKNVESRYAMYEYEDEHNEDDKSVLSETSSHPFQSSYQEDGLVLTESNVRSSLNVSPPLQRPGTATSKSSRSETRVRIRSRAGSVIVHDIQNEFLLVSDTLKEYAKLEEAGSDSDIMEIDEDRLSEELYEQSKALFMKKMQVVERLEARSKLMVERVKIKKKVIEQERREKLEKVLTSSMLMSHGHPAEVRNLRTGFLKELREELDSIKKRQETKRPSFVPNFSAYQFDEEMTEVFEEIKNKRSVSPQPGKQKRHFVVKPRDVNLEKKARPHTALGVHDNSGSTTPLKVTSFSNKPVSPMSPMFMGPIALNRNQMRSSSAMGDVRERPKTALFPTTSSNKKPTVQEQIEYIQPHYLIRPSTTSGTVTGLLPAQSPNITVSGKQPQMFAKGVSPPILPRAQSCPPPETTVAKPTLKPIPNFQSLHLGNFSSPMVVNDFDSEEDSEEEDGERWDIDKIERYADEIKSKQETNTPKSKPGSAGSSKKQIKVLMPKGATFNEDSPKSGGVGPWG